MKNFVIEIVSQTASFRDPGFQNFHKTLELPPPTTIMGLCGAAMGLTPLQAQEFFKDGNIMLGVHGNHSGKCHDTWKYNKRFKEMWKYDPGLDGSVIQKEFLIQSTFYFAFSSGDESKLKTLYSAFQSPVYALTVGNSDSLAFIKAIYQDAENVKSDEVDHCMIEGDIINEVIRLAPEKMEFSIYQTSEPIAHDLPVRFEYENDYGKRAVSSISTFSIVVQKMKLNYEIEGLKCNDVFIPLFRI